MKRQSNQEVASHNIRPSFSHRRGGKARFSAKHRIPDSLELSGQLPPPRWRGGHLCWRRVISYLPGVRWDMKQRGDGSKMKTKQAGRQTDNWKCRSGEEREFLRKTSISLCILDQLTSSKKNVFKLFLAE